MKKKMIELLREHLGNRGEPEIQALLKGLEKMNKNELKGIIVLILDREKIINPIKALAKRNKIINNAYYRLIN